MQGSLSKTFEYDLCEAPQFKNEYVNEFKKKYFENLHDSRTNNNRETLSKISFRNNEEDSIAIDKFGELNMQQI
jgi:hypothetical protein